MEKQNIFTLAVAAFVLIVVFAVSGGLVKYWNNSVSDMQYKLESDTLMDMCSREKNGSSDLTKEDKVTTDDKKPYVHYVYTCTYNRY